MEVTFKVLISKTAFVYNLVLIVTTVLDYLTTLYNKYFITRSKVVLVQNCIKSLPCWRVNVTIDVFTNQVSLIHSEQNSNVTMTSLVTYHDVYKIPFGMVDIVNGQTIAVSEDTYLRLSIPEDSEDVVVTETEGYDESYVYEHAIVSNDKLAEWHDASTKLLLEVYKQKKALVENRKLKSMKQMWELIAQHLQEYGYTF
ncbi:hypothetical protein FQR65_LT09548 [Abscondita terminalis]|nr:hypothetical protein FQR65_LT09548 [Abscondita terminalis]